MTMRSFLFTFGVLAGIGGEAEFLTPVDLTQDDALAGWVDLYDGATTFGFDGARRVEKERRHYLEGGKTTTEFADFELRALVAKPGTLKIAGQDMQVQTGMLSLD